MTRPTSLARYFVLSYAISWACWAPLWLPAFGIHGIPVLRIQHELGAYGPSLAALICVSIEGGADGRRALLSRLAVSRESVWWLVAAVAAPYLLLGSSIVGAALASGRATSFAGFGTSSTAPAMHAVAFLLYNFATFGIGEEIGWRGFALPRMQSQRSALASTMLLTLGWAGWHAPLFLYRSGFTDMGPAGSAGWLFSLLTGSVLLTWFFNSSRGSVLVVALFHAAVDVAFGATPAVGQVAVIEGVVITFAGVLIVAFAGPARLSHHDKVCVTN
jgi:uncharacterized protein